MIKQWLDEFKSAWTSKDIEHILGLYIDDVEYWENPHTKLVDKDHLKQEWSAILKQYKIELNFEIFSQTDNMYSVLWDLSYLNDESVQQNWAGTYLIKLDDSGKCNYFHQTGEKR